MWLRFWFAWLLEPTKKIEQPTADEILVEKFKNVVFPF